MNFCPKLKISFDSQRVCYMYLSILFAFARGLIYFLNYQSGMIEVLLLAVSYGSFILINVIHSQQHLIAKHYTMHCMCFYREHRSGWDL